MYAFMVQMEQLQASTRVGRPMTENSMKPQ